MPEDETAIISEMPERKINFQKELKHSAHSENTSSPDA
jgi:hypothetical protein